MALCGFSVLENTKGAGCPILSRKLAVDFSASAKGWEIERSYTQVSIRILSESLRSISKAFRNLMYKSRQQLSPTLLLRRKITFVAKRMGHPAAYEDDTMKERLEAG
jgi:hypothetical protein